MKGTCTACSPTCRVAFGSAIASSVGCDTYALTALGPCPCLADSDNVHLVDVDDVRV